jgi:subtilisin
MAETRNPQAAAGAAGSDKIVERGKRQLLIAPRRGAATAAGIIRPMSAGALKGVIATLPDVDVVQVLKPRKMIQTMSATGDDATDVYVVRTSKDRAELLKQAAPPNMIVEDDAYLDYGGVVRPLAASGNVAALSGAATQEIQFRVVGDDDKPVSGVKITLTGDTFPAEGETDKKGEVTLDLVVLPNGRARSLYVVPGKGYWDRFVVNPDVSATDVNVIKLLSLKASVSGFPDTFKYGWGHRMMGLDRLPQHLTGRGVKIGIIDSGADNTHPLLQHLKNGVDLTNNSDQASWANDVVGHGSHCAGVIGARNTDGIALRGFAPEAEIHVFKIFPGGQFSSLLDAIDQCMARDVDIINMSLGSSQPSEAVEQKITEAVMDGIACIVAAGNSGGPVQYPASSPNVMAVAAIGKLKEFPSEAWDSQTVTQGQVGTDGIFSPSFTCFGPQVAVCAPGVAIISTVPGGYEPESGTSMAAPHVTGLAAILLAHHPAFQTTFRTRGPQRVAALFSLVKSVCAPCSLGQGRTGFGIPKLDSLFSVLVPAAADSADRAAAQATTPQPGAPASTTQPVAPMAAQPQFAPQSASGGMFVPLSAGGGMANFGMLGSAPPFQPSGQFSGVNPQMASLWDPRAVQLGYAMGWLSPYQQGVQLTNLPINGMWGGYFGGPFSPFGH